MDSDLQFLDGYLGVESEVSVVPRITYPFGANPVPDVAHRRLERQFQVAPRSFSPRIATRSSPINFLTYSEDFSNAVWAKTAVTVTADAVANPNDGRINADLLSATGADSYIAGIFTPPIVLTTAFSIWLRCASGTVPLSLYSVRTSGGGLTTTPITVGPTWQRFTHVFTPLDLTNHTVQIGGGSSFSTGEAIYAWGAQIDVGSATPGIYIPTTSVGRSIVSPDVDAVANSMGADPDPFAYLVGESDLAIESSARALFTRLYARLPADQVFPGAKYITRPVLHDIKSGTAFAVSFDESKKFSHIFTSRKTISALSTPDVPSTTEKTTAGSMPSATITITLTGGSSFTFNTTDSAATIQGVCFTNLGTCTVVKSDSDITIEGSSVVSATKHMSVSGSGISLTADNTTIRVGLAGGGNNATNLRTITATAHGGVVGDRSALWAGDRLYATGVVITVPTADTFTVELDVVPGKDLAITHCGFSTDAASCVVNGTIMCSIRRTQKYFLPGVSVGITTAADIPAPAGQMDPISWLAAIIAGSAWIIESVGDLAAAPGLGCMIMQETIELQMSDAVDLVTP